MNKPLKTALTRRGFTILELLIVISIIAIIATLATGAAIKSIKQSRVRRIEIMAKGLEVALMNYRAQENKWPFDLNSCVEDLQDKNLVWIHGQRNVQAFEELYVGKTHYLDESAYLVTASGGRRGSLKEVLKAGGKNVQAAFGYPKPDDTSLFCHYCVRYSPLTDTVKIIRQDQPHWTVNGQPVYCPELQWTP